MSNVLYEKKDRIAYITLNRPKVNAINFEAVVELHNIWDDFRDDDNLWVAILSGVGNNFSAGFDISEFLQLVKEHGFKWRNSSMFGDKGCSPGTHSVWKPIVAALDGVVNGVGFWLALECDIRIATKEAAFALGEIRISSAVEFSAFITHYVPLAIANEMLLTANSLTAERAYNLGMINKIVPREQLMSEATAMANTICKGGPLAARAMKELVHRGWDMDSHSAEALSASMIPPVVNSEDFKEGTSAFAEKRKPVWKCK
jgi:enoyl-CoA hydratase/carnithine racemase